MVEVMAGILSNPLIAMGLTMAVVLVALGLGWLGFGLFAVGDRVVGWLKRAARWPGS